MSTSKESRIAIAKMNLYHTCIMTRLSGYEVLEALNENWTKVDHNHFEHSTETIQTQIKMFDRQLDVVTQIAETKDVELLKSSLSVFMKDRQTLKNNLQFGKITVSKNVLIIYISNLNNAITQTKSLIELLEE